MCMCVRLLLGCAKSSFFPPFCSCLHEKKKYTCVYAETGVRLSHAHLAPSLGSSLIARTPHLLCVRRPMCVRADNYLSPFLFASATHLAVGKDLAQHDLEGVKSRIFFSQQKRTVGFQTADLKRALRCVGSARQVCAYVCD